MLPRTPSRHDEVPGAASPGAIVSEHTPRDKASARSQPRDVADNRWLESQADRRIKPHTVRVFVSGPISVVAASSARTGLNVRTVREPAPGHPFVQNLCRGHYELAGEHRPNDRVRITFDQLAAHVWPSRPRGLDPPMRASDQSTQQPGLFGDESIVVARPLFFFFASAKMPSVIARHRLLRSRRHRCADRYAVADVPGE